MERPPSRPRALRSRDDVKASAGRGAPRCNAQQGRAISAQHQGVDARPTRRGKTRPPPHARGSPSHGRRRNTQAHNADAAPPVRRLDEKRAQRVRRLAPLHLHRSVAPARRPRLAPAFARSWGRRADRLYKRCAVAVQGRRAPVDGDAGEADAEPATEFQRDAAPADGARETRRVGRVPVAREVRGALAPVEWRPGGGCVHDEAHAVAVARPRREREGTAGRGSTEPRHPAEEIKGGGHHAAATL